MQDEQQPQKDHALLQKTYEYLRITRNLRWIIIAAVVVSFPLLPGQNLNEITVVLLITAAALYNLAMHVPGVQKQPWLSARPSMLLVDSAFILALLCISNGKVESPYTALFIFPIISAAFWYGAKISVGIGIIQLAIASLLLLPQMPEPVRMYGLKQFVLQTLIFIMVGLYVALLTLNDRHIRLDFAKKDFQVNQERQQLLALINNIVDAVIVVDQSGKIGLFNDATAKLVGSQYALVGKPLSEVFKLLDMNNHEIDLSLIHSTTPVRRRDLKVHLPDSSTINVEADISPYIVNQQRHGFIILMRDITKERTVEQQQSEFISVASHELRTPLAIAEADIATSLDSPNAPRDLNIRNMLTDAHNNIMFLSNIINDLTTLSKAERDDLEVDLGTVDPAMLVRELGEEFTEKAHAKTLAIYTNVADDVKPILSSYFRVKQIVQNFVTNAIKYTQSGSITISVENAPKAEDGIIFSVKDTGIGISVSDQKKVFTKFFRSEDYQTRQSSGTGLGLYISSKLAARLNGKVWFESEFKKGSTFYLQVPPYSRLKKDHKQVVKAETENLFKDV